MNQNCSHLDIVPTLKLSISFFLKQQSTKAPLSCVIIYNKVCINRRNVWMMIAQTLFHKRNSREYQSDDLSTANHTNISLASSSYRFSIRSASDPGSVPLYPNKLSTSYHQALRLIQQT